MDLRAVKAASRPGLLACAAAAAENGQGLLDDAESLSVTGRHARPYSLAVLAVEEFGKATSLVALAAMPANVRAQAPVGRMLEWHQLKLVGSTLMAVLGFGPPGGRPGSLPCPSLRWSRSSTRRMRSPMTRTG